MKFTILAILIIIFFFAFVLPTLYREFKNGVAGYFDSAFRNTATSTVSEVTPQPTGPLSPHATGTKSKSNTPPGFQGPTGAPHIIGPTSPPPNY